MGAPRNGYPVWEGSLPTSRTEHLLFFILTQVSPSWVKGVLLTSLFSNTWKGEGLGLEPVICERNQEKWRQVTRRQFSAQIKPRTCFPVSCPQWDGLCCRWRVPHLWIYTSRNCVVTCLECHRGNALTVKFPSSSEILGIFPRDLQISLCTKTFITVLFIIPKEQKQPICLLIGDLLSNYIWEH